MKCLSVSQPFADLIVSGAKKVDLRNWNTRYRGEILIHAPVRIRDEDCRRLAVRVRPVTGAIVGRATLVDVRRYGSAAEVRRDYPLHLAGPGFEDRKYGFVLDNPIRFKAPVPWKGRLGLFEVRPPDTDPDRMVADIIDEDYRYQWIGRH